MICRTDVDVSKRTKTLQRIGDAEKDLAHLLSRFNDVFLKPLNLELVQGPILALHRYHKQAKETLDTLLQGEMTEETLISGVLNDVVRIAVLVPKTIAHACHIPV